MTTSTTITVTGMTCGHCVGAVESELGQIDGVRAVLADLDSGAISITSDGPLDPDVVVAAVGEAGYEVAR